MADGGWNGADIADLLRELRGIREALEEHNELVRAVIENFSDGSEERPFHVKYVADDLVAVSAYFEGGDPRPLPTIEGGVASAHEGMEHVWPAELTPDTVCEVEGCTLRYADWTAGRGCP